MRVVLLIFLTAFLAACGETGPSQVCNYTLSGTDHMFEASGGTGSVGVSTMSQCAWSASSNASWATIQSGSTGTGPGTVVFVVSANPDASARSGTLTVAGSSVSVSQTGLAPCTYAVSPSGASFDEAGGAGAVDVAAPAHCDWTAQSADLWVTITGVSSGRGDGRVDYLVAPNDDPAGRATTLMVAGQPVSVSQSGDVLLCQYAVAPVIFDPCMVAPEMTTTLTTQAACPWTADVSDPWITLTTPASGAGSDAVRFTVDVNWDRPRSGVIRLRWPAATAGQNLLVRQAGCYYTVTQSVFAFTSTGGSGMFDVFQQSDPITCGGPLQNACQWTAVSDVPWITITTSVPRTGDDRLSFTVAPNPGTTPRTGHISVRDQVVVVTQAGS